MKSGTTFDVVLIQRLFRFMYRCRFSFGEVMKPNAPSCLAGWGGTPRFGRDPIFTHNFTLSGRLLAANLIQ